MTRSRPAAVAVALLLAALPASAAPVPVGAKAKDVTDLPVAANSMAVLQLNGVGGTKDRVVKMLGGADADLAKKAGEWFDEKLKVSLEGRDLAVLDPKGRVFVAVGDFATFGQGQYPVTVAFPTSDYKGFREKFLTEKERKSFTPGKGDPDEVELERDGSTMYLVDTKDGYVLTTPHKDTATAYAGKYDRLTVKQLGAAADPFLAADAALYVNLGQVNDTYGATLKQFQGLIGLGFQQAAPGLDPKQAEQAKAVVTAVFQAVLDGRGVVLAVEARPEGANLSVTAEFKPDTDTAAVLKDENPTALPALAALPAGQGGYSASRFGKALAAATQKLFAVFEPEADDDKTAEAIAKLVGLTDKPTGETVGLTAPDGATLIVTAYDKPDALTDATTLVLKNITSGGRYRNIVLKEKPTVKAAEKHAGFALSAANVEVDYDAAVKAIPTEDAKEAAIAAMKKLVPEKQTLWFGSDGKRFVQVLAKDWETAKPLLDAVAGPKAKAGDDAAFKATRSQLPAEASYLLLTDVVASINGLSGTQSWLGALPGGPGAEMPKLEPIKGGPFYLGVAVAARPASVRLDVFVPVAAVKAALQAAPKPEPKKD